MSMHIKLSEIETSKLFQSAGSPGSWFGKAVGKSVGNLGKKKSNIELWCSFGWRCLPGLVGNIALNAASNAINKIERRISGKRVAKAGKEFTSLISNEDKNDIIRIIKSLEDSGVLTDGVTETVKHET